MLKINVIYLILFLSLTACSGGLTKKKAEVLQESIKQYNIALRWAQYNKVQDYHKKRDGSDSHIDRNALKNIRVTGYTVQEKVINEELTEATVKGVIDYYNNEYATLKKIDFTYVWWYEAESKRWFNESDLPDFQ